MKGTIKWFNNQRGYGFIVEESGSDIFVHYSQIIQQEGYKTLAEGDSVEYEVSEKDGRKIAVNVRKIQ